MRGGKQKYNYIGSIYHDLMRRKVVSAVYPHPNFNNINILIICFKFSKIGKYFSQRVQTQTLGFMTLNLSFCLKMRKWSSKRWKD